MERFWGYAKRLFGIDVRALAAYRIGLALILLGDLAVRATDLEAHYTDLGVLPRGALLENWWNDAYVSLHLVNGTFTGQVVLFLIATAFALSMLVGYRTRVATVGSWFLLISLQTRNPMLLQGGDVLLRQLLFWAMFLPLGAAWSFDNRLRGQGQSGVVFSMAGVACLLQPVIMYCFTALLKSGREWIPDGTATYYALHIEQFVKPFGIWFRQFPEPMRLLTVVVWWFELLGPFLLFWPENRKGRCPVRWFAILGFIALHVGLNLCMELAIFPWVSTVATIPFLTPGVWDWVEGQLRKIRLPSSIEGHLERHLPPVPAAIEPVPPASRFHNGVAACFLFYVLCWNAADVKRFHLSIPEPLHFIGDLFRIDQFWNMFAPYPLREDGWYVIPGKLEDGSEVDLFNGVEAPVSWSAPPLISAMYTNDRWRSYYMMLWLAAFESYRPYYADYLCRTWNLKHQGPKHLASLEIFFMSKPVLANYQVSPPEKLSLWQYDCDN